MNCLIINSSNFFATGRDVIVKYCNQCVCLSVRSHISETTRPNFRKFIVHVTRGRGLVLL